MRKRKQDEGVPGRKEEVHRDSTKGGERRAKAEAEGEGELGAGEVWQGVDKEGKTRNKGKTMKRNERQQVQKSI